MFEKCFGLVIIIVSVLLNALMIMLFYKSLKILGTTIATSLNFSFNITITVRNAINPSSFLMYYFSIKELQATLL